MSGEPKTYRCCDCCPRDPIFHADNPPDSHDVPCETCYPTCGHDVERIRREAKAEALRELARDLSATHVHVPDGGSSYIDLASRADGIEADDA